MNMLTITFIDTWLLISKSRINHLLSYTFSFLFLIISTNVYSDTLFDFNFKDNLIENGFGNWSYVDKGTNYCNIYAGENFSKLCSSNGLKFYPYYNYRNNDHMGWLRYGYIDSDNTFSISNESLKVTLTGGAYESEDGEVAYLGDPIFSKTDFDKQQAIRKSPEIFERELPGNISFYYKGESSTSTFPELQGKNRLTLWVLMPKIQSNIDYYAMSSYLKRPDNTFSLYPFINTSKGGHYYHRVSNIPMGGWTKMQFDAHPQHHNSGDKNPYSSYPVGGYEYPGNAIGYFNNITSLSFVPDFSAHQASPYSFYIDNFATDLILYENDETINNVAVGYDQQNKMFDVSFSDKYRCLTCDAKYLIKYAFSPIDLSNFDQAFLPEYVINFDRSKNNPQGEIYKPNSGYNNIWAALNVNEEHLAQLKDGTTIYFAIRDISDRTNIEQEPIDFVEQLVPNVGSIKTIDLLKTISYPIHLVNYPLEVKTIQLEDGIKNHYYNEKIDTFGGTPPYTIQNITPLPEGIALNNGTIVGSPTTSGVSDFDIKVTDASSKKTTQQISWLLKTEEDFNTSHCVDIVDFGSADTPDKIYSSAYNEVISDTYTNNLKLGKSITIGQNSTYNYQGVQGIGINFNAGDVIKSIWYNNSELPITFTPMISFNDSNRRFYEPTGLWLPMESITINSYQYQTSNYVIPQTLISKATLININMNYDNHQILILDKIQYVSNNLPLDSVCVMPFSNTKPSEQLIVDFLSSDSDSIFELENWVTIIKDIYTDYYRDGLTITIGSNPSYNFQGVTGQERLFVANEEVHTYWHNSSDTTITFTPKISFTDNDRRETGNSGEWFVMNPVEITPNSTAITTFKVSTENEGWYSLINVNSNISNNRQIILDKITLISQE
jgi:hypothetical protein